MRLKVAEKAFVQRVVIEVQRNEFRKENIHKSVGMLPLKRLLDKSIRLILSGPPNRDGAIGPVRGG